MKKGLVILCFAICFILLLNIFFISAGELKVTQEHPFLIEGNWVSASDLQIGDELTLINGSKVKITSIEDVSSQIPFFVYNLEAGIYHDFVVSSEDGLDVVVHNSNNPKESFVCQQCKNGPCISDGYCGGVGYDVSLQQTDNRRFYLDRGFYPNLLNTLNRLEIDPNMRPILKQLWKRGYRTSFSCEGGGTFGNTHSATSYVVIQGEVDKSLEVYLGSFGFRLSKNHLCCDSFKGDKLFCGYCGAGIKGNAVFRGPEKFCIEDF